MELFLPATLKHLPNPTLIVTGNRQILFADIIATSTFDIIIGKDLALTFRHPDVLNAIDRTLASKTVESVEFSIPGPLAQVFELHTPPIPNELGTQFVLLSLQDKNKAARSEEIRADFVANASHGLRSPLSATLKTVSLYILKTAVMGLKNSTSQALLKGFTELIVPAPTMLTTLLSVQVWG